MPREDFLLYLDNAAGYASPWRATNGVRLDSKHVEELLRKDQFTQWLSRTAVKGFRPEDYQGILAPDKLEMLKKDVSGFRKVAETLDPKKPATDEQINEGLPHFVSMLAIMRPFLEGFNEYWALKDAKLRPYIQDYAVSLCEDSTGVPAIKIWVIIDDDIVDQPSFYRDYDVPGLENEIREILENLDTNRYPYIYYRSASNQQALEEASGR